MNLPMLKSNFILTHCYTIYLSSRGPYKVLTKYKVTHIDTKESLELSVPQWRWIEYKLNDIYLFRYVKLLAILFSLKHTDFDEMGSEIDDFFIKRFFPSKTKWGHYSLPPEDLK